MPDVFKNNENLIQVGEDWIERLKKEAKESPNRRARLLMHHSGDDLVQEMIIAFCKDSNSLVHRSLKKSESLQVLEGRILVAVFDDDGNIKNQFEMAPLGSGNTFIYRIGSVPWHIIIPLSDIVVIHESLQGPFEKIDDPLPHWAPKDSLSRKEFIEEILM